MFKYYIVFDGKYGKNAVAGFYHKNDAEIMLKDLNARYPNMKHHIIEFEL